MTSTLKRIALLAGIAIIGLSLTPASHAASSTAVTDTPLFSSAPTTKLMLAQRSENPGGGMFRNENPGGGMYKKGKKAKKKKK